MTRETILSKIEKLLRLSKSDNQHEAELALARANELMTKHGIAQTELSVEDVIGDGIQEEEYVVEGQRMKLHWITQLAFGCAKFYDGTILVNRKLHGTSFTWVGLADDILLMKATFEHLYNSWFSIVKADLATAKRNSPFVFAPKDTMKFKQGHALAYAHTLFDRMEVLKADRDKEIKQQSQSTALVVVKEQALADWKSSRGIRSSRQKISRGSAIGATYGHRSGSRVPLGGALNA